MAADGGDDDNEEDYGDFDEGNDIYLLYLETVKLIGIRLVCHIGQSNYAICSLSPSATNCQRYIIVTNFKYGRFH